MKKIHLTFLSLLTCVAALTAAVLSGGETANALLGAAARRYLASLSHLSVSFVRIEGNPFDGYAVTGLKAGTMERPNVVSAGRIELRLDAQTWELKKPVLVLSAQNVRLNEGELSSLADAAAQDFPASNKKHASLPVALKQLALAEVRGAQNWEIRSASADMTDVSESGFVYAVKLSAAYQKEAASLTGTVRAGLDGSFLGAKLNVKAPDSSISCEVSAENGRIAVDRLTGKLFSSPVDGKCSVDLSQRDMPLRAFLTMKKVNFRRLRRWIPQLGGGSLDSFELNVSGPAVRPQGRAVLRGGSLTWQGMKLSAVSGTIDADARKAAFDVSAQFMGANVSARGSAELTGRQNLKAKANVDGLSLQEAAAFMDLPDGLSLGGTVSCAADVSGTLTSPQVRLTAVSPRAEIAHAAVLTDISAELSVSPDKAELHRFSLKAFGGALEASGAAALSRYAPKSFNFQANLKDVRLEKILPKQDIRGRADGSIDVSLSGGIPNVSAEAILSDVSVSSRAMKQLKLSARGSDVLECAVEGRTPMNMPLTGRGTIVLPLKGAKGAVDFALSCEDISLASFLPKDLKIGGTGSLTLYAKGALTAPLLSCRFTGPRIQAQGFTVMDPDISAQLKGKNVVIDASFAMGDRRPRVAGIVELKEDWRCELDCRAEDILVGALAPAQSVIDGRATLSSHAVITREGASAVGSVTAPSVSLNGLALTDLRLPFSYLNDKAAIRKATAKLGGGTVSIDAEGIVSQSAFQGKLSVKDADIAKIAAPFGIPAQVSGTANLTLTAKARLGITMTANGDSRLTLSDVEIKDFPGSSMITGNEPIRIKTGNFFFSFDENELYLLPGSALSAPPNDKVFRFLALSGSLWRRKFGDYPSYIGDVPSDLAAHNKDMYSVIVNGNINVRALNRVLSGFSAILESGMTGDLSGEALASNVLKNMLGTRSRFRNFSMEIDGKDYSDYQISELKIESDRDYSGQTNSEWGKSDDKPFELNVEFKYAIPVGPDPSKMKKKSPNRP